jgi:hypothetical protein
MKAIESNKKGKGERSLYIKQGERIHFMEKLTSEYQKGPLFHACYHRQASRSNGRVF